MTMLEQRIQQQFFDSADLKYQPPKSSRKPIADAVSALVGCITSGGKVLACGNGGSAADAQHFAAEFVGRFERERPGLAAIALTTDTLDPHRDRQRLRLRARSSPSRSQALGAARRRAAGDVAPAAIRPTCWPRSKRRTPTEMTVVALTGNGGGKMRDALTETDVHICVPHERTARIQEVHLLVLHCLCDAVDLQLLGEQENT